MEASFSVGTSAKENTQVSTDPGLSCQGIQSVREDKSCGSMGNPEQTLLTPVSRLLSEPRHNQIFNYTTTQAIVWQGTSTIILNVATALQFS